MGSVWCADRGLPSTFSPETEQSRVLLAASAHASRGAMPGALHKLQPDWQALCDK